MTPVQKHSALYLINNAIDRNVNQIVSLEGQLSEARDLRQVLKRVKADINDIKILQPKGD